MRRATAVLGALAITLGFVVAAPAQAQAKECKDPVVRILKDVGFTGNSLRIGWAIVMRESKGQNLSESSPWYSGALGFWQIQTSAHSSKPWWSRAAMLNPKRQTEIVYKYMTRKGTWWQPWGITPNGRGVDASQYGGWSQWQITNWIWVPYWRYYQSFPRGC